MNNSDIGHNNSNNYNTRNESQRGVSNETSSRDIGVDEFDETNSSGDTTESEYNKGEQSVSQSNNSIESVSSNGTNNSTTNTDTDINEGTIEPPTNS